jgi:hypothetical protein
MYWDEEYNYIESMWQVMERCAKKCELMSVVINSMNTNNMHIADGWRRFAYLERW